MANKERIPAMPISFGESSGGGAAYIRVNMPQNRWRFIGDNGEENLDMTRGIAIDIKNVTFGWMVLDVGRREWEPWPSPSERTAKPSDEHKQGFLVKCWLADGREAEFSGNSYGQGQFIAKLYNAAEKAPEFGMGMVPIVQVTSSTPVAVGKGTSYDLGFTIAKWIAKPSVMAAVTPAPAPAAAPASADIDAFGF